MNISLEGEVGLVTGAASGLGFATAKSSAESGESVALADVDAEEVQAAAKELVDKGFKTLAICCDVSNDDEVEIMVCTTAGNPSIVPVASRFVSVRLSKLRRLFHNVTHHTCADVGHASLI